VNLLFKTSDMLFSDQPKDDWETFEI